MFIKRTACPYIDFWKFTDEQEAEIKTKYVDTGKRLSFSETYSDDQLIQTWEFEWVDAESFREYADEFISLWMDRTIYNTANDIISSVAEH